MSRSLPEADAAMRDVDVHVSVPQRCSRVRPWLEREPLALAGPRSNVGFVCHFKEDSRLFAVKVVSTW